MDFLIQNAWYSIEVHGHVMAFIPWNSIGTSGKLMAFHGTLRYSMEFHGPPSILHGIPWNFMVFHGTPWILPGYSMEVPWNSMDFADEMMEFHGIPWRYFTRERPKHPCYITIMLLHKCKK